MRVLEEPLQRKIEQNKRALRRSERWGRSAADHSAQGKAATRRRRQMEKVGARKEV